MTGKRILSGLERSDTKSRVNDEQCGRLAPPRCLLKEQKVSGSREHSLSGLERSDTKKGAAHKTGCSGKEITVG